MTEQEPLFCDRCLRLLRAGRGEFYEVRIEAVADPSPPDLDIDLDAPQPPPTVADVRRSLNELSAAMGHLSEREAMDQVIRRVSITLCNTCYSDWIENPGGGEA